jgi:hypothetical protein
MKYKPKSIAALHIALGGLPDKMRVQTDSCDVEAMAELMTVRLAKLVNARMARSERDGCHAASMQAAKAVPHSLLLGQCSRSVRPAFKN